MDFSASLQFGFDRVKANPGFYVGGGAVLFGLSMVVNLVSRLILFVVSLAAASVLQTVHIDSQIVTALLGVFGAVVSFVLGLIVVPFGVGYFRGIRKDVHGEPAVIGDLFSAFDIALPSILNYALAGVVTGLGFLFCILPGIALMPVTLLTVYFLVNGRTEGISAFTSALNTLRENPMLIVWNLVVGLIAGMGVLACCVGVLFTVPIAVCALYKLFDDAAAGGRSAPSYY